jgi:predicted Zn-dependent protease
LDALGRSYLALGNQGLARENFKRISQLAGFDAAWQQRAAQLQLSAGDYEGARYSLGKALLGKPGYYPALYLKAVVEKASGNLDAAEQQARDLLAGHPREAALHRLLGDIAMQRKRYDDAVVAYRTAYDQEKGSQQAISLYRAYLWAGNTAKALEFVQFWARSQPADLIAQRTLAEAYGRVGKLKEAQQILEMLSKKLPNDAPIHNALAYVMLRRGEPGALAVAQKAYQLAPSDANVLDTMGWALVQGGQAEKGLRYLRDAQVRAPNNPEIRSHLDEVLKRLGRNK